MFTFKRIHKPERSRHRADTISQFNAPGVLILYFPYIFKIIMMKMRVSHFPELLDRKRIQKARHHLWAKKVPGKIMVNIGIATFN